MTTGKGKNGKGNRKEGNSKKEAKRIRSQSGQKTKKAKFLKKR